MIQDDQRTEAKICLTTNLLLQCRTENRSEKRIKKLQKKFLWNMKIISSLLPPFWLAFSLPASLPLPSLLLPCVFHLLPERVIKVINL